VHLADRRLRLLIGIAISDSQLIRPTDEPEIAPVVFDWPSAVAEALKRRPELEQQRLLCKRRELELIAARNFLMPRLDAVGRYRVRGLGQRFAGGTGFLDSAWNQLGSFNFQEWEVGFEYALPVGFRQGHAAVQNAEFQIAHSKAILREQERQIIHDLGVQVSESARAYEQCQTNLNRYLAANDALNALEASRDAGLPVSLDQLLDIQRRLTEAQVRYYQSRLEYALALKNVHFEKGSLLEYSSIAVKGMPTILDDSGMVPPVEEELPQELEMDMPTEEATPTPAVKDAAYLESLQPMLEDAISPVVQDVSQ
jgi:outer membrane protein TolC